MRIIAFITEALAVREVLAQSEVTSPPRIAPPHGPPLWQMPDAKGPIRPHAQLAPDYEFDQRIAW